MKRIFNLRRHHCLAKASASLIVAALIAGMAGYGCTPSEGSEIRTWYGLDAIRGNLSGDYTLMNDLDSTTAGYRNLASPIANGGRGWEPIGGAQDAFTGSLDGRGYEIRDLYLNRSDEYSDRVGLFGQLGQGGLVENVGVVNATVICHSHVDGLVGTGDCAMGSRPLGIGLGNGAAVGGLVGLSEGTVNNSYYSGHVTGDWMVGGLVGMNDDGTVSNSYSTGSVTGGWDIGGLVGDNFGTVSNSYSTSEVAGDWMVGGLVGLGDAVNCYSTGNVTGEERVGGLVGFGGALNSYSTGEVAGNQMVGGLVGYGSGPVSDSYSTGNVIGNGLVGGLVGFSSSNSTVSGSYSTGNVTGEDTVGGLVGQNSYGTVSDSYSTGSVTGSSYVGGLVGVNLDIVSNSYSTGSVTGNDYVGGLVGSNYLLGNNGTVSSSFWDIETSAQSTSDGGTGKNTTDMQDVTAFSGAGWNIITVVSSGECNTAYIWNIVDDETYPFLSWES